MPNSQDQTAARLPMVPGSIAVSYGDAMARLPKVRLTVRRPTAAKDLPAVGSFHA